jgi:hypothetical protein
MEMEMEMGIDIEIEMEVEMEKERGVVPWMNYLGLLVKTILVKDMM